MSQTWQHAVEEALGLRIVSLRSLSGGDFAAAYAADLIDGSRVFVKTHKNPPACFFSTEATGLSWLRDSKTVRVPEVLAVSDAPPFLVLEWVDIGHGNPGSDSELGAALAELHRCPQQAFGRRDHRTTGSLGVPNAPCESWAEFYSTQRLIPLAKIAEQRRALSLTDCRAIIAVAEGLTHIDIADEPASLLHGDLWAGNRIVDTHGISWLIDPAAHCGHREFDLAMMRLFGGYSDLCFSAYCEAYPLQPRFAERVALHQLAPLAVHAIKFGGSYAGSVKAALDECRDLIA